MGAAFTPGNVVRPASQVHDSLQTIPSKAGDQLSSHIRRITKDEASKLRAARDEQADRLAEAREAERANSLSMLRGVDGAADRVAAAVDVQRDAHDRLHLADLALDALMREPAVADVSEVMTVAQATERIAVVNQGLGRVAEDEARITQEREQHQARLTEAEAAERANALPAHRGDGASQARLDTAAADRRDAEAAVRVRNYALEDLKREREEYEQQRKALLTAKYEAERNDLAQHRLRLATELDADCARLAQKMIEWRELNIQISGLTTKIDGTVDTRLHYVWPRVFSHHFATVNGWLGRVPPHLGASSTFVALSRQFTANQPDATADAVPENTV
jgi:hypothetical protein